MKNYTIILLILSFLLVGCASKRYMKKGVEFEKVGYFEKAADMYYISLVKNKNNVESTIGLRKNGQLKLDKMLNEFQANYDADLAKEAVYKYREGVDYIEKVKAVGVELNLPSKYKELYAEVKDIFLETVYQEAYLLLEEQNFAKAEEKFNLIIWIDPDYADVNDLKKTAHYEPIYRKGKEKMLLEKYRTAYNLFKEIIDETSNYKDAHELADKALQNALITIGITDFTNYTHKKHIEQELKTNIEKLLTNTNSPFIKIVDRNNAAEITSEQLLTLEGKVDETVSSKAGKILGVKALLSGVILTFDVEEGKLIKSTQKGYLKEKKIVEDKNGLKSDKIIYNKTNYYEFTQENKIQCKFQFKLISTETSEVLLSDIVSYTNSDLIHYVQFDGDSKNLIQGYWESKTKDSPNDYVKDNSQKNRELQRLLKAPREVKSIDKFIIEANAFVAKKVATKIENYDPEK